ncbi:MAG: PAS domain-containing protein [Bacteroidetes bacterium]|nr:PAS domain-containing protein [Bacteroidota bacterium]
MFTEEDLQKSLKEADYKYALEESCATDQRLIKYANDNFCTISKYSRDELIGGSSFNSGFHPKNKSLNLGHHCQWKNLERELKNKAKDGSFYWVDTTIIPFLNDFGKPYQYVAIRADITMRKGS